MKENTPIIDFVVTWMDGNDENWRREKRQYESGTDTLDSGTDDREERYRDWELLAYWFRGIEKYAPWVRTIHFVTWGHLPKWLNVNHPKLHIVRHEDFIPKQYLPVFNSNVIELHMHRIPGLAEHFVYFNDDIFITGQVKPEDFFRDGKPCDMLAFQPVVANPQNPVMSHMLLNNMLVLSKYFNKRENIRKQPGNYFHIGYPLLYFCYNALELAFPLFTGLYSVHGTFQFCKSTFEEVWEKEQELLEKVSAHRFRSSEDVTPYLFREWQKLSGQFCARNITRHFRYFNVGNDNSRILKAMKNPRIHGMCINDANTEIDFEKAKEELRQGFEQILPEKSSFEK